MSIKSIKNVWLSSILLCGSVVAAPQIQDQYFCNLPVLKALEKKKLEAFVNGFGNKTWPESEEDQEAYILFIQRYQMLLVRLMQQHARYADLTEKFSDLLLKGLFNSNYVPSQDDVKECKALMQEFVVRMQQDPEFTSFAKNLVGFGCKQLSLLVDQAIPYYIKINTGSLSEQEVMAVFVGYIPQNVDVVQTAIEYVVVSHGYLKKQFDAKKALTTDDLCHVLKELGVAYKLPKQGLDVWNEFVVAMQKGLKDLPQDVRNEIMKPIEDIVRKPELEIGMRLVTSMAKMRREIIATKGADQGKIIGYGKLMDQVVAQIHKASAQKVVNKNITTKDQATKAVMVLERLIFKN